MFFDLKQLRERKGLTREQLTEELNRLWRTDHPTEPKRFSQDMLLRLEKEPDRISLDVLTLVIKVFGITFDQLLKPDIGRLQAPNVTDHWGCMAEVLKIYDDFVKSAPRQVKEKHGEELRSMRYRIARKGRIACIGRPDSGKSRTINTLLGKDILPTDWTPTTAAFIMLKSAKDRPDFMGFDMVYVAREGTEEKWNPDRITDEEYSRQWQLDRGGYELIEQYGMHGRGENLDEVGAVVVYVDSPFLDNCDLLDMPGFYQGGDDPEAVDIGNIYSGRDTQICRRASVLADAFIYLSIANSFLYGDDLAMALGIVKASPTLENHHQNKLAPFGNIFIVATQAMSVDHGNKEELTKICDSAAGRLWKLLDLHPAMAEKLVDSAGLEYSGETLRRRFFTSEMDSADLTKDFYQDLAKFTEMLPLLRQQKVTEELTGYFTVQAEYYDNRALEIQRLQERDENALQDCEDKLKQKMSALESLHELMYKVHTSGDITVERCSELYTGVLSPKHVVETLEQNNWGKNKRDIGELINWLNVELERGMTNILGEESKNFILDVEKFLNENPHFRPFFYQGVSQIKPAGALTVYHNSARLLREKGETVVNLTDKSPLWHGVATVVDTALVFSLSLTMSVALACVLAFGGTWKKLIGNRFVREYKTKQVLEKLQEICNQYWGDTHKALSTAVQAVEDEIHKQEADENTFALSTSSNRDELEKRYEEFRVCLQFFLDAGTKFWFWQE